MDTIDHESEIEDETNELSISAITLNCWGLLFFSKHRLQRIQSIADYLSEQKYDIVFLQELWVKSDYELIRQKTSSIYKFAHLFPTKSIIGTSGLAILSKWSPTHISFMPFTVNGSPFRPWHGDWFTGKGTGYIRVDLNDLRIHLFCTHMHAQYSDDEDISDQYSIHRICQSYQLAKFINMTEDLVSNAGKCELFLLAGDLNTSPEEFPFQLLKSITGLNNICHPGSNGFNHINDLITCGNVENSFTDTLCSNQSKDDNNSRHKQQLKQGKQIDFILYKMVNDRNSQKSQLSTITYLNSTVPDLSFNCTAEKLQCQSKDPKTGLSFSDHQPVAVRFKTKKVDQQQQLSNQRKVKESGDHSGTSNMMKRGSFDTTDSSSGFTDSVKCPQLGGTNLEKASKLMRSYINENEKSKLKLTYSLILFALTLVIGLFMVNLYHDYISSPLMVTICSLLILVVGIIIMAIEISFRFEQHGIKSILEEMDCSLSSSSLSPFNQPVNHSNKCNQ
ncbi:sphingomyelin phosphodiesterase 2-like [Panonychus citri]|uniref:sphingomyelin phosphodiesterase 2-like n=1 Tax=Panonychus citri TaxID=50023 RepID=UPI0023070278|nr:sphingomyelin phosphodiesterase 2-like [Panonychus citri]